MPSLITDSPWGHLAPTTIFCGQFLLYTQAHFRYISSSKKRLLISLFVHAIAMSGHKWFGTPWPSGIYMTKTRYQLFPPDAPEYLGSPDATFAGSRNGFSSLLFWSYLSQNSYSDQARKVQGADKMTGYAYQQLVNLQEAVLLDLWVTRSPLSFAVLFRKPNDWVTFKYSLSCQTYQIEGESRTYAHIFMMEHVIKGLIDRLVLDLREPDAFIPNNDV